MTQSEHPTADIPPADSDSLTGAAGQLLAEIVGVNVTNLANTTDALIAYERDEKIKWAGLFVALFAAVEQADPIPRALMRTNDHLAHHYQRALEVLERERLG